MKLFGKFLCSHMSSLVRGLFPLRGCSRIVRNSGFDLLSRRDHSVKLLSYNFLKMFLSISILIFVSFKLIYFLRSCSRFMVAPDEFRYGGLSHRVTSDRVHRLLVTLSYFRPDRFVQLLSLIPILIFIL